MRLDAEQITAIAQAQPLVSRTAPNFRNKKDRKAAKHLHGEKTERRENDRPGSESSGRELDTYI